MKSEGFKISTHLKSMISYDLLGYACNCKQPDMCFQLDGYFNLHWLKTSSKLQYD